MPFEETLRTYGLELRLGAAAGAAPPARDGGAPGAEPVAVVLRPGPPPSGWRPLAVPGHRTQAEHAACARSGRHLMRFPDGPAFVLGRDAIEVHAFAGLAPEELRWYLLGPVAAFWLRLHGRLLLHAAAVLLAGGAVALAGPSGAGKSTLAAALVRRGAHGVTDDLLLLERGGGGGEASWLVHPGPPRHLLWPDAAATGLPAGAAGPGPNPCRWDKRALAAERWSDPAVPVPLRRLLLLAPAGRDAAPAVRRCAPSRAVAALVASLHAGWFGDARRRALDLDGAAALVGSLGARELVVPRDLARLPEVAALVEAALAREPA